MNEEQLENMCLDGFCGGDSINISEDTVTQASTASMIDKNSPQGENLVVLEKNMTTSRSVLELTYKGTRKRGGSITTVNATKKTTGAADASAFDKVADKLLRVFGDDESTGPKIGGVEQKGTNNTKGQSFDKLLKNGTGKKAVRSLNGVKDNTGKPPANKGIAREGTQRKVL